MTTENTVWSGKSSQLVNLPTFLIYGSIAVFFLLLESSYGHWPKLISILAFCRIAFDLLQVNCTKYTLTNERLIVEQGVFYRQLYEIELYQISNLLLVEPMIYRLFNYGDIRLIREHNLHTPEWLHGIKDARNLRELIRKQTKSTTAENNSKLIHALYHHAPLFNRTSGGGLWLLN